MSINVIPSEYQDYIDKINEIITEKDDENIDKNELSKLIINYTDKLIENKLNIIISKLTNNLQQLYKENNDLEYTKNNIKGSRAKQLSIILIRKNLDKINKEYINICREVYEVYVPEDFLNSCEAKLQQKKNTSWSVCNVINWCNYSINDALEAIDRTKEKIKNINYKLNIVKGFFEHLYKIAKQIDDNDNDNDNDKRPTKSKTTKKNLSKINSESERNIYTINEETNEDVANANGAYQKKKNIKYKNQSKKSKRKSKRKTFNKKNDKNNIKHK
jgi:hypothetical protein